jgi:hypothetical protein
MASNPPDRSGNLKRVPNVAPTHHIWPPKTTPFNPVRTRAESGDMRHVSIEAVEDDQKHKEAYAEYQRQLNSPDAKSSNE